MKEIWVRHTRPTSLKATSTSLKIHPHRVFVRYFHLGVLLHFHPRSLSQLPITRIFPRSRNLLDPEAGFICLRPPTTVEQKAGNITPGQLLALAV